MSACTPCDVVPPDLRSWLHLDGHASHAHRDLDTLVDGISAPPSPGAESRPAATSRPLRAEATSGSSSELESPSEVSTPDDLLSEAQHQDCPGEPIMLRILINGIEHFVDLANPEELEALAFLQSRSA